MLIAVLFLAVSLVCNLVPTVVLGVDGIGWLTAGLLAWALDVLLGGYLVAVPGRRAP